MPKSAHRALARAASRRGLRGTRRDAYIYGTLARIQRAMTRKRKGKK